MTASNSGSTTNSSSIPGLPRALPMLPAQSRFNSISVPLTRTPFAALALEFALIACTVLVVGACVIGRRVSVTGSSLTREVWTTVAGVNVRDIPVETPANMTNFLGALEGITDFGDNYGERIRGYFTAPITGNYSFWLAASDSAELWISNDGEPANKVLRSYVVPGGTAS